ncbi:site-specific integrase [Paenibacillus xylanexedens]|uniref:tyrosine-type recombinase/integrase n=1 Tax=Paenibacillus xylanexedens TaxID=528191 RepID=UPI0011A6C018|nr:site-specific integrase [Paenibacillus xylanexedens]
MITGTSPKVVELHSRKVFEDIMTFVSKFESKHTQKNYERSIRNFYLWLDPIHKDIEYLNEDDLKVRNADMLRYQKYLKDHEADYTNNTINNYIAPIQSLYEFLEINEYKINSKHVKIDSLTDDSEQTGALYLNEAEEMAKIILDDRKQGQEKSAFIRMAYTTSFRKSSLRKLKWTDIVLNHRGYYDVYTIGKGGKKHKVPISTDLYNELLKIKERPYYNKYEDDRIFHLGNDTIQSMMDRLKEAMCIPEERNIKFHSFRNVAAGFGTLEEAKNHLNHSNISTTETYYRHANEDLSNSISLRMEDKIDDSILEHLSKEELVQIIIQQNHGVLSQIKRDVQDMLNNKVGKVGTM